MPATIESAEDWGATPVAEGSALDWGAKPVEDASDWGAKPVIDDSKIQYDRYRSTISGPEVPQGIFGRLHSAYGHARDVLSPLLGKSDIEVQRQKFDLGAGNQSDREFFAEHPEQRLPMLGLVGAASRSDLEVPTITSQDIKTLAPGTPDAVAKVAAGTQRGVAGALNFFLSPLGVATLGIGSLPSAAQRVIAGAFAVQMGSQVPELATELGTAVGEGDTERATELAVQAGLNTVFTAGGAGHALGSKFFVGGGEDQWAKSTPPIDLKPVVDVPQRVVPPMVIPETPVTPGVVGGNSDEPPAPPGIKPQLAPPEVPGAATSEPPGIQPEVTPPVVSSATEAPVIQPEVAPPEVPGVTAGPEIKPQVAPPEVPRPKGTTFDLFQGKGKTREEIYGAENVERGAGVPMFGKGEYYAFTEEDAANYGKVTRHKVVLENPFILDSDAKWFKLLKDADAPHLNNMSMEHYKEPELIPSATEKVQEYLKEQGHDGVVVKLDPSSDDTRRLGSMAGHDQVVKFADTETEGGAADASIEKGTLPRQIEGDTPTLMPDGEPISLDAIRRYLSKALDIPVRMGVKIGGGGIRRALGLFRIKPETIRMKSINDIPTLAHEVGHYLHYILFPSAGARIGASKFAKTFDSELLRLGARTSLPSYSEHQVRREGVAEFFREWLTDRSAALAKAPKFTNFFEAQLQAKFPEVWKIVKQAQTDLGRYINQPAQAKVRSMISYKPRDESVPLTKRLHGLYTGWVDELHPIHNSIDRLVKLGLPEMNAAAVKAAVINYIGGWKGKVEHTLFEKQLDFNGNTVGRSLREVLRGVESTKDLSDYLVSKRALEKNRQGKGTGINTADAQEVVNNLGPKYERVARELREFQRNNLFLLRDSGILSDEQVTRMDAQNLDYVPFYRVYDRVGGGKGGGSGKGFVDTPQGVGEFKGSDRQIVDPLESIVKNSYLFRDLAERNRIGTSFIDAVESIRGGGRVGESIARKVKPIEVKDEETRAFLKSIGLDAGVSPEIDAALENDLRFKVWRGARNQSAKDGVFTVWKGGKEHPFQIDDPELYRALQMQDSVDSALMTAAPYLKPLRSLSRGLRVGATGTLEFMARNPFRDQVTAAVFSKHGYLPFFDGFRGILSALRKDDLYWKWVKSGGKYADFIAGDRTDLIKTLDAVVKEPGARALAAQLANPLNVIHNLQKLSEFMEQGTRIGEFDRALKAGLSPMEAANASKDVTLNFSRHGLQGKLVNDLITFFNAGIQDIDKTMRAHLDRPLATAMKGFMTISTPSLLAWWLGKDDKDIQQLPEWRKNYFWNFKVAKDGHVWSLPKPFLLGQLYGTSIERGLDMAFKKDPNAVRKWFSAVLEVTAVPMLPTGLRPLIENLADYSFFQNRSLEPGYVKKLPTMERATPQTSTVAKEFAKLANITTGAEFSPIKIDNTVRGLLGGLGKYGTDAIDWVLEKSKLMDIPSTPKKDWTELPLVRGFTQGPYAPSVDVERFYKGLELAEQRVESLKSRAPTLQSKEDQKWLNANMNALAHYEMGYPNNLATLHAGRVGIGEISKAMRQVETSRELSPETKRARLIELNQQRNDAASKLLQVLYPADKAKVY